MPENSKNKLNLNLKQVKRKLKTLRPNDYFLNNEHYLIALLARNWT